MGENVFKEYQISVLGLSQKTHHYTMELTKALFDHFENDVIEDIRGRVAVRLTKSSAMMTIEADIDCVVTLICDRSLDPFEYPLQVQERVFYKYGGKAEELDDNVYVITPADPFVDLSVPIYDAVMLAIPMRKLHPRFAGEANAEDEVLFYTSQTEEEEEKPSQSDPRWEALRRLKN